MKSEVLIGIVGSGADKFTPETRSMAKKLIYGILHAYQRQGYEPVAVSGHSPVGGIDIWTEDMADMLGIEKRIYPPKVQRWEGGYKQRNMLIAKSNIVHVIVVDKYPESYTGRKFNLCYHCDTADHIKSGGCWTGKRAIEYGNEAQWHVLKN